jgi:hypothetical protein
VALDVFHLVGHNPGQGDDANGQYAKKRRRKLEVVGTTTLKAQNSVSLPDSGQEWNLSNGEHNRGQLVGHNRGQVSLHRKNRVLYEDWSSSQVSKFSHS